MFYADLHIHSRFSRATSKDCNLEQLAFWASRKGISVIGTGDFTHPAWLAEIKHKLVPAEAGLFRLHRDLEKAVESKLASLRRPGMLSGAGGFNCGTVRFLLEVEISTIYKKGDLTRKVHHVICVPDIQSGEQMIQRLARIGNLGADGRPILGLDSRDLLEITLESGAGSFLIPAHIWTPWFSALGSKSGFDSMAECYGDLAQHIFAVETGLSSDPPMNWRLSSLDRYRLVSNSDAHSPDNIGREACVFNTDLDYFAMRRALETGAGYGGTVEFFPEEGKYHLDGHRNCGICFSPTETRQNRGRCPVCGKEVTVGVMYRVEELADRPKGTRLPGAAPFRSFVPMAEILSEIFGAGPDSKKVQAEYTALLTALGPEIFILEHAPLEDIRRADSPLFAEAIGRMREGRVIRKAGFDGAYGTIKLFAADELKTRKDGAWLLDLADPAESSKPPNEPDEARVTAAPAPASATKDVARVRENDQTAYTPEPFGILDSLDPDQRLAAETIDHSLLIIAGPGTGKTRTLTHRIAHLVANHGIAPENCLAIAFTRRAAGEIQARLQRLVPAKAARIPVMTFHALGHSILREHGTRLGLPPDFRVADEDEILRILAATLAIPAPKARRMLADLSRLRRKDEKPEPVSELAQALDLYRRKMRSLSLLDFDDLIVSAVELLETSPELAAYYRGRFPWISIDEYQDIDAQQYRLAKLLVLPTGNICAIGDPDQAIYGFRGTDAKYFRQFKADFPDTRTVQLTRNYRSGRIIVEASLQVIAPASRVDARAFQALVDDPTRITIHESPTDLAEVEFVVHAIEKLIGGTTFFSMDSGRVQAGAGDKEYSFSDFAVLYRADVLAAALCEAFARSGMPFQKRSHQSLMDTPVVQAIISAMRDLPETLPGERLEQALAGQRDKADMTEMIRVAPSLRLLAGRCGRMEEFLSELAMGVEVDLWDSRADCVSLLTLHASKGLEFPVVFIVGCENGILPLRWGASATDNIEEERRLFFVGMTRARERLFLCHARKRFWQGKIRPMEPSSFLQDIEEQLLERSLAPVRGKKPRPDHEQLSLF